MTKPPSQSARQRAFFSADGEAVLLATRSRTVQLRTAHTALRTERLVSCDSFAALARDVAVSPEAKGVASGVVAVSMFAALGLFAGLGSLLLR
jgi:hypothetical protein